MIDEKKFIEFMTALDDAGAEHVSFDDLRKFVDEFPKIGCWIPCSERLPDSFDTVLAFTEEKQIVTVARDGMDWVLYNGVIIGEKVIAWQPLPEPYIENQKDMR